MRWRALLPFCIMPAMPSRQVTRHDLASRHKPPLPHISKSRSLKLGRRVSFLVIMICGSALLPAVLWAHTRTELPQAVRLTTSQPSRTPSAYIGSVMALLATFDDAGILPPEGSPQANGIIKAVIQFQSAFLKSHHPSVQEFFAEAHRTKFGPRAGEIEASFRRTGWSADSFNAVIEAGQIADAWKGTALNDAFREFNIGKSDFDLLAGLYEQSIAAFSIQGKTFREVYTQRRREMPGATSE
jgi:hypothetical protein